MAAPTDRKTVIRIWELVANGEKTILEIGEEANVSAKTAERYKSILDDYGKNPNYEGIRWERHRWRESTCSRLFQWLKEFREDKGPEIVEIKSVDIGHPHLKRLIELATELAWSIGVPAVGELTRPGGSCWEEPFVWGPIRERPELTVARKGEFPYLLDHLSKAGLETLIEDYLTAVHEYAHKAIELDRQVDLLVRRRDAIPVPVRTGEAGRKHFVAALIWDSDDRQWGVGTGFGNQKRDERSGRSDGSIVFRPLNPFAVECISEEDADLVWEQFDSLRDSADALSEWRSLRLTRKGAEMAMIKMKDCLTPASKLEKSLVVGGCEECPQP